MRTVEIPVMEDDLRFASEAIQKIASEAMQRIENLYSLRFSGISPEPSVRLNQSTQNTTKVDDLFILNSNPTNPVNSFTPDRQTNKPKVSENPNPVRVLQPESRPELIDSNLHGLEL